MQEVNETQEQNYVGLTVQREARCTNDLLGFSDRKILEFAAKAADISGEYCNHWEGKGSYDGILKSEDYNWNPLCDEGDALILASRMCFYIEINQISVVVKSGDMIVKEVCSGRGDRPQAILRAITFCAAQIGRART